MKEIFAKGDTKTYSKIVSEYDIAQFEKGVVHPVYSTFAVARDAEWCGRLFVLDMKENDEEGIGTHIHVTHISPAFVGREIEIISTFEGISDTFEILTSFEVFCEKRIIAKGTQGQKILKKEKINSIFEKLK